MSDEQQKPDPYEQAMNEVFGELDAEAGNLRGKVEMAEEGLKFLVRLSHGRFHYTNVAVPGEPAAMLTTTVALRGQPALRLIVSAYDEIKTNEPLPIKKVAPPGELPELSDEEQALAEAEGALKGAFNDIEARKEQLKLSDAFAAQRLRLELDGIDPANTADRALKLAQIEAQAAAMDRVQTLAMLRDVGRRVALQHKYFGVTSYGFDRIKDPTPAQQAVMEGIREGEIEQQLARKHVRNLEKGLKYLVGLSGGKLALERKMPDSNTSTATMLQLTPATITGRFHRLFIEVAADGAIRVATSQAMLDNDKAGHNARSKQDVIAVLQKIAKDAAWGEHAAPDEKIKPVGDYQRAVMKSVTTAHDDVAMTGMMAAPVESRLTDIRRDLKNFDFDKGYEPGSSDAVFMVNPNMDSGNCEQEIRVSKDERVRITMGNQTAEFGAFDEAALNTHFDALYMKAAMSEISETKVRDDMRAERNAAAQPPAKPATPKKGASPS